MFDLQGRATLLRYVSRKAPVASKTETMTETTLETILLVEDEPAVRQLFAQALKRAGYAVYEARNGQEAMKLFDHHGESIDMLLTDMRMPYMGGAELAHHLRGRRRTLKLLCISGYPGNLDAELKFAKSSTSRAAEHADYAESR